MKVVKTFQEKIYQVVAKIPKGRVLSYKEVARRGGNILACRAVGNIMNRHNIKGLPCHRVICSDGRVGGYRWGTKRKIKRPKEEGAKIERGRIIGFKRRK